MVARLLSRPRTRLRRPIAVTAPPAEAFRVALPWLLVSLTLTMAALFLQVPTWSLVVFGICTLWRYWIARRGGLLPSMIVRVLVFLSVAAGVLVKFGTKPEVAGMLTILIALLSLKILELRSGRDFTVVALLGYFMALSGFFYDQSLLLSLYLCAALFINTIALVRCHSGGQRSIGPAARLALGLTAQSIPLVVLLFVVFPRIQGTFLHRLGGATTGMMGMSEHLQPGSFSSLAQSDALAFHAKIGKGQTLPQSDLYWRGLVLDECETSLSWKAGAQAPADGNIPPPGPQAHLVDQQITLFPQYERWLFALDRPVTIRPTASIRAQLNASRVLLNREPLFSKVIYTATSELNPVDQPLSQGNHRYFTKLPLDVSDRARALAAGWRAANRTDDGVINAAKQFFRAGGFAYTLTPGLMPREDPLDYFLFESRRGFCEHYAAAFTTLMRAAGLPARVVIGYQGGEYNDWGGHYIVRQSDAHAWSEVWVNNDHWQREDPTAVVAPDRVSYGTEIYTALSAEGALSEEARLERLSALNTPGSVRWLVHSALLAWDGLDQQWNLSVLGYDQEKQQNIFQKVGVDNMSLLWGTAWTLTAAFSILMVGTGLMRMVHRGPARSDDPVRRWYERFCRRLTAAADVRRDTAEGPLDFARRAAAALPHEAPAIQAITDLYIAARYAPAAAANSTGLAALRNAVRHFRPGPRKA